VLGWGSVVAISPLILDAVYWFGQGIEVSFRFRFLGFLLLRIPVILLITCFIHWYIGLEIRIKAFIRLILAFFLSILLFGSGDIPLSCFLRWELIGIVSVLLVRWWARRSESGSGAFSALLYNRLGDIIFLVLICLRMRSMDSLLIYLLLFLSVIRKSSLIGFNYWLPVAMEGPTPVSSLLHSATIVVAGLWMLIRVEPSLSNRFSRVFLWMGIISCLISRLFLCRWIDVKKCVAFSTSSHLRVIVIGVRLGIPRLVICHILFHGWRKRMIFVCSGVLIHHLNNNQDLRLFELIHGKLRHWYRWFILGRILSLARCIVFVRSLSKEKLLFSSLNSLGRTLIIMRIVYAFLISIFYTVVFSRAFVGVGKNNSKSVEIRGELSILMIRLSVCYLGLINISLHCVSSVGDFITLNLGLILAWIISYKIYYIVDYSVKSSVFSTFKNMIFISSLHGKLWDIMVKRSNCLLTLEF